MEKLSNEIFYKKKAILLEASKADKNSIWAINNYVEGLQCYENVFFYFDMGEEIDLDKFPIIKNLVEKVRMLEKDD